MAGQEDIDKLPEVSTISELSKFELYEIIKGINKNAEYCDLPSMIPQKVLDWCRYLECAEGKCLKNPSDLYTYQTTTTIMPLLPNQNETYGVIKGCYDAVFCVTQEYSGILHFAFGIFGLLICIAGIFGNAISLPAFSFHGRMSGTEVYLLGIVIIDLIYLILTILLRLIPFVATDLASQIRFYSRFSVHLIPWLGPFEDFAKVASSWMVIGLLFDRFIYIFYGMSGKESYSRKRVSLIVSVFMLILSLYHVPRLFEFTLICNHEIVHENGTTTHDLSRPYTGLRVIRSWMGSQPGYLNAIYNHLKIPLNYVIPILLCSLFFGLICARLPTRVLLAKLLSRDESRSTWLSSEFVQPIPESIQQRRKLIYARERRFVELSLFLGTLLMVFLINHLIYDCIRLESSSPPWNSDVYLQNNFAIWEIIVRILDFVFPAIRPIAYAFTCHEYMAALRDMFCCRKPQEHQFYRIDYKEATFRELMKKEQKNSVV